MIATRYFTGCRIGLLRNIAILLVAVALPIVSAWAAPVQYQQGLAYARLGRLNDAYTQLQLAANLDPKNSQIALALGVIALRLNEPDEALRALENSITLDANSCASYYYLALIYEKKGLRDRAAECWHHFDQLNPDPQLRVVAEHHIQRLENTR